MKVYRHWARVDVDVDGRETRTPGFTAASGWSDQSLGDARAVALERAQRFARWWREGGDRLLGRYAYADRPVREPIVEEVHHDGRRIAAITRNGYGAWVLNTARVLFADVDRQRPTLGRALGGVWAALRGRKGPNPERELIDRLGRVAEAEGLGLRVYRTRGGHRVMVTSATFEPASGPAKALLESLGSDPLYVRLCELQACFRARLTPKPWRVKVPGPDQTMRFPWRDDAAKARFDAWSAGYEAASVGWAVCEPVATLGEEAVHGDVRPVLTLHDELTCRPGKPLA